MARYTERSRVGFWLMPRLRGPQGFKSVGEEIAGREGMNSTEKTARLAGVLYLVNGVTGFFSIIYVPGRLIVSGNAAATANKILASESFFPKSPRERTLQRHGTPGDGTREIYVSSSSIA
jgi:hypothetical protein